MKPFDLVVFGATSFVGKLVVRHLLEVHGIGRSVSWAIAGRSQAKLASLRDELGTAAKDLPILLADAEQLPQLKEMCAQTKVVVTTAGPFVLYGEKLIQACAETGTDYCDITGETPWVADMMARYQAQAQRTGARLVNFCGFDSIPSDMGVHFLQKASVRRFGKACAHVKMRVYHARGNPPGGTYATAMDAIGKASDDKAYRAALTDPYLLCPPHHGFTQAQNEGFRPSYDPDFKQWTAMFVMGAINTRVVHRSNALSAHAYGKHFQYEEAILVAGGLAGRLGAYLVSGLMFGFLAMASFKPTRHFLSRFLIPKPGTGSNLKSLEKCSFDVRFVGQTEQGEKIKIRIAGPGDPACYATSRMLAEAGLCMALNIDKPQKPGGFWTPSSIFSDQLVERLERHADFKFEVID